MTVEKVATIKTYQGISTDEKPTGTDAPAGTTFHAVDTGEMFVAYVGGWVLDLRRARSIKQAELL